MGELGAGALVHVCWVNGGAGDVVGEDEKV
jgi:hypothetical protein